MPTDVDTRFFDAIFMLPDSQIQPIAHPGQKANPSHALPQFFWLAGSTAVACA
jgi:hypothetical protein